LNKYDKDDLVEFNNALSLILLIDKIRRAEDIAILSNLPEKYIEGLAQKIPEHFLKIFSDCVQLLLKRVEVPDEEVEAVTEKIYKRRLNDMFEIIDGYSVTKTREKFKREYQREMKTKERKYNQELQSKENALQSKEDELQSKEDELQSKESTLQSKESEIQKLQAEIERLKNNSK
jgi:alpha-galactosidase/6-phospho-beta-glucosidase family protein